MFMVDDLRSYLYEYIDFYPVSVISPVIWSDENMMAGGVFDITNSGDLSVTAPIAEVFMSFDPYGVSVLPSRLHCVDGASEQVRYIVAINNEVDLVDEDKSSIETKVIHYNPEKHGYDVPLEERKSIVSHRVSRLYLDEKKLKSFPEFKRHMFRVKNTETFFFSEEVFNALCEIGRKGKARGLTAYPFDVTEQAPKF